MTAVQRVIRVARQDSGFVLLGVEKSGPNSLDVNLYGTENEQAYTTSISHDNLAYTKAKTDDFTDEAWRAALSWVLLLEKPPEEHRQLIERVYVVASFEQEDCIVLTFRENIEGLTPRVGSIVLEASEHLELDLFEWAGIMSEATTNAEQRATELQARYVAQQETLDKLNAQLQEFTEAKKRQEDEMLEKFRQLLNTKKLKIRDQQRLLAGAKIDPSAAQRVRKARAGPSRRQNSPPRRGKRKANGRPDLADAEMKEANADVTDTEGEDEFEVAKTPPRSNSEEESDGEQAAFNGEKGIPERTAASRDEALRDIPPVRELPFEEKSSTAASPAKEQIEVDEDDTTDDEL